MLYVVTTIWELSIKLAIKLSWFFYQVQISTNFKKILLKCNGNSSYKNFKKYIILKSNWEYVQIVYCTVNRFTLLMSAIMNYNMQTVIQRERSPYLYYPCEKDLWDHQMLVIWHEVNQKPGP